MRQSKRKGFHAIRGLLLAGMMFFLFSARGYASGTSSSYLYDEWEDAVAAPESYTADRTVNGLQLGIGSLSGAQDLFLDDDGLLYISDTGNNRIVILDADLNLIDQITTVILDGEEIALTSPQGLYVTDDGEIYIAESTNARILIVKDLEIVDVIEKPESALLDDDFSFQPIKISIDQYGRLYVLSKGCYSGLLQFDTDGSFMGFFGANRVEVTVEVVLDYFWKSILSDEQRSSMTSIIPIEYSNVFCAGDGFVYTSTVGTTTTQNQVKKLNPLGNNVYYENGDEEVNFGDYDVTYTKGVTSTSQFVDVNVDSDGFIFALDQTRGKIFEKDQEGNFIAVFGQLGNQEGTFSAVSAIETWEGYVYVLDPVKNNITRFAPTEYELLVREATVLYNDGYYQESVALWQEVLKRNINSTLAYKNIGKALVQSKDYEESMEYLSKSGDKYNYSLAFTKYRLASVREYGVYVAAGIVVIIAVSQIVSLFRRRVKKGVKK